MNKHSTSRQSRKLAYVTFLVMIVMALSLLSGCGVLGGGASTIAIGTKDFTEQVILGELYATLLEDAGYSVERQFNLGGTAILHESMTNGELDMYVEYTGTALTAILEREAMTNPEEVYQTVSQAYAEQFNLEWLEPLGFNNTYALAMSQQHAEELGVQTISDLVPHAGDLTLGAPAEFMGRPDGLPGLQEAYGLEFASTQPMDIGLMYQAVASGDVDVISAFATDGRIATLDLFLLEDNKNFFPPYDAAPVVRQDTLQANEGLREVLNRLGGQIDAETMRQMNAAVDQEGRPEGEVAREFLEQQGMLTGE